MNKIEFQNILQLACSALGDEARKKQFSTAKQFENRVREVMSEALQTYGVTIDFDPHPQAFPDIAIGEFGIEVKFTENDTWRSVANSVLETNRIDDVKTVYVVFCKMGGGPDVKWDEYESCVMHVRTSHVPRFELEIGSTQSLFRQMDVSYDVFRKSKMHEKMQYIRKYARGRLKPGERMWWLEDKDETEHTLPLNVRLYTKLNQPEKVKLRSEAILLCPSIVQSGRARDKYDDVVLYLMTYHGVLCHQARDLFSAGSVANPKNDDEGGIYIERAIKLLEPDIRQAALRMESAIFEEYWGVSVEPKNRIKEWLLRADRFAKGWVPSQTLFLD